MRSKLNSMNVIACTKSGGGLMIYTTSNKKIPNGKFGDGNFFLGCHNIVY